MATHKLSPARRRMLERIARGDPDGVMLVALLGEGSGTYRALRRAGLIAANYDMPSDKPDFIRITDAGRTALAERGE